MLGAGGVPNMSEIECLREIDNKGKELYKLKNPPPQPHSQQPSQAQASGAQSG